MRPVFCSLMFIVLAQAGVFAQCVSQVSTQECPDIDIKCPDDFEWPEKPLTFTAFVRGGDIKVKPTFTWSIYGGKIIAGQGTSTITVGELVTYSEYTATVKVNGYPEKCTSTASCTLNVHWLAPVRKFDEYGNIEDEDEMARLDYFSIELSKEAAAIGYMIAYAGRRAHVNEALARLERAKDYLVKTRAISIDRILIIDGGYRDELTVELYVVPSGSNPPVASPTVEAAEVQIIKNAPRRTKRRARRH